jgi:hypothetical protein
VIARAEPLCVRDCLEVGFQFRNSLEGLFSQGTAFAGDVDFSDALDMWHASVERRNQLLQVTEFAQLNSVRDICASGHCLSSSIRQRICRRHVDGFHDSKYQ